jgi:hypothetical protein
MSRAAGEATPSAEAVGVLFAHGVETFACPEGSAAPARAEYAEGNLMGV